MDLNARGIAGGIFLSSAVRGGAVPTMDRLIAVAEELRGRHAFRGYVHLKILPGAQDAQVERAGRLATRVSLNLEVPAARYLPAIAPGKSAGDLTGPLDRMRLLARTLGRRWSPSGYTTQFVVGGAGETDREIVTATDWLYRRMGARRAYFSAFQPVEGTPMEGRPACPLVREHRLYQCDFLLRKYGFVLDEIPFEAGGGLSAAEDPKSGWARAHPELFPVEINAAPPELLMRVPGIGPKSARRIAAERARGSIGSPADLARIAPSSRRAAPFLLFNGRRPPRQLELGQER
jgi:predicted DNA-binding helix-hairpin-helix protein